jgi:PAS domain S-box-containing protein
MDHSPESDALARLRRISMPQGGEALLVLIPIILFVGSALVGLIAFFMPTTALASYTPYAVGTMAFIVAVTVFGMLISTMPSYVRFSHSAAEAVRAAAEGSARSVRTLAGSGLGFWEYDVPKGEMYFSSGYMSLLGLGAEERNDKIDFWYGLIHPDDVDGVRRTMNYHFDRRTPDYSIEYRIRRGNGEYVWVADKGKATFGPDNKAQVLSGTTQDVSNMHRVQQVLETRTQELETATRRVVEEARNAAKFKMAVDSSLQAVAITDPLGKINYVNGAWSKLNGYDLSEITGKTHAILRTSDTKAEVYTQMYERLKIGETFTSEEIFNQRRDGSHYQAALSIYPIREGSETIFYVGLSEDITQRKEVDKAKTEFVSLASHQLRTPLSAIRWYSEMLMSKRMGDLNDKQMQYLKEIYHGNIRMVDLVNALLNTSRIDLGTFAVEPEPVNLSEMCQSVINELTPQITERQQTTEVHFEKAPAQYPADPKLMRIIFQNLLSNSVKYTQPGGHVGAEIEERNGELYISIWDNGYGIPRHQQDKIFEKLFRADNVRQKDTEGTGLGMYIIKAIIDSSNGKIWFESEEDKGTRWHVTLPMSGMVRRSGTKGLS